MREFGPKPYDNAAGVTKHPGTFNTRNPLLIFLHEILRDHLPAGIVEELVARANRTIESRYVQDHKAALAQELTEQFLTHEHIHEYTIEFLGNKCTSNTTDKRAP